MNKSKMKVVVLGGSGMIGTKLVNRLRNLGCETLATSPSSGVDTVTGEGLESALSHAQAVVDVTNARVYDDAGIMRFFETSTHNILAAEKAANVGHHILLSVVNADGLQNSGYMRGKVAQETIVKNGDIPFTILCSTQFFEFLN